MVNTKEIKSVKLAPFTLMTSSINAIIAFIVGILMFIAFGTMAAFIPQFQAIGAFFTAAGAALIIIYPLSAFFITLAFSFFSALLYNGLVPRLGGVKLGLEGNEVTHVPVVPFALILSAIMAIWTFIFGVFATAAVEPFIAGASKAIPVISHAIANATNATHAAMPTGAFLGLGGLFLAIFFIIILPLIVFIAGFIVHALIAIFYNYIATRAAKVQLNFTSTAGKWFDLTSIPVVPAALAVAIAVTIFAFIFSVIPQTVQVSYHYGAVAAIGTLIGGTIGYFLEYFIGTALFAIFYNALAPRIGAVKLELE